VNTLVQEIPIVAKEATFLISLATEEFIKRLTEAGYAMSQKERRTTVQHKDLGMFPAVRSFPSPEGLNQFPIYSNCN
jgi:histone H3/H4